MSLVLFDLDGTLVDSGPGIRASVRHAAATAGIAEPTEEQLRALIGPPFPAAFGDVLGVDAATGLVMMDAYRDIYGGAPGDAVDPAARMFDVAAYEGVPELLGELVERGDVLAVTTSKPAEYAREIVRHVGLAPRFAGGIHGAELDGSVEGKAAVVGLALAANTGERVVALVGDRHHDVEGASTHGLPCVGVGWGFGGRAELEAAGAAAVVDKPAELPDALDALA